MTEAQAATSPTLDGTYTIVRHVGAGGMADVYKAWHERLQGHVAIKVLRETPLTAQARNQGSSPDPDGSRVETKVLPETPVTEQARNQALWPDPDGSQAPTPGSAQDLVQRFQREGQVLFKIQHPNIVQLHDLRQMADGRWYMAMEYLDGIDLEQAMKRDGKMPLARVVDLTGQIAAALSAVHSHGIVHRDLKPSNIRLVKPPGETCEWVKLLDFGLARPEGGAGLTRMGCFLGTPEYMAPEQASPQPGQIDQRTDEFALAAITCQMLTGRLPFPDLPSEELALVEAIRKRKVLPFLDNSPNLPPTVADVITRGLDQEPERRYGTVRDFHQALARAAAQVGEAHLKHWRYWPMVVAVTMLLVGGLAMLLWPRGEIPKLRPASSVAAQPIPIPAPATPSSPPKDEPALFVPPATAEPEPSPPPPKPPTRSKPKTRKPARVEVL